MTTISRHVQDLRSRVDAAIVVAIVVSATFLAIAAGAFVAATQAPMMPPAEPVESIAQPETAAQPPDSHDDHPT